MLTAEMEEFVGRATRHIARIARRPLANKYPNLPIAPVVANAVRHLLESGMEQIFAEVVHPFRARILRPVSGPAGPPRERLDAMWHFELLHPPTKRGRLAAFKGGSRIQQLAYYGLRLMRTPVGIFGWEWRIDIEKEGMFPILSLRGSAPTVRISPAVLAGAYCYANYGHRTVGPDRPAGMAGAMARIACAMGRGDGEDPWAFVAAAFEDDPYLIYHDFRIREEPATIMADWLEERGHARWAQELRKFEQERSAS